MQHSLLSVLATVSLSSAQVLYPFSAAGYAAGYGYAAYGIPVTQGITNIGTPASTAAYTSGIQGSGQTK